MSMFNKVFLLAVSIIFSSSIAAARYEASDDVVVAETPKDVVYNKALDSAVGQELIQARDIKRDIDTVRTDGGVKEAIDDRKEMIARHVVDQTKDDIETAKDKKDDIQQRRALNKKPMLQKKLNINKIEDRPQDDSESDAVLY